jgi:hypothetical protein
MNQKIFYPILDTNKEERILSTLLSNTIKNENNVNHIKLDDELFIYQIPKIVKDTTGFTILTQDNKIIGYISKKRASTSNLSKKERAKIQTKREFALQLVDKKKYVMSEDELYTFVKGNSAINDANHHETVEKWVHIIKRECEKIADNYNEYVSNNDVGKYFTVGFSDKHAPELNMIVTNYRDYTKYVKSKR